MPIVTSVSQTYHLSFWLAVLFPIVLILSSKQFSPLVLALGRITTQRAGLGKLPTWVGDSIVIRTLAWNFSFEVLVLVIEVNQ